MTWVIGANTPFGYGFLVSDIRVTFSDGTTMDAVQKIYKVGDFIGAGFAGSVRVGFGMIRGLTKFLDVEKEADECWIPEWVANEWASKARELFTNATASERRAGCSILLVGAHPTEDGLNGAKPYTAVLRSPSFEPRIWGNFDSVQSIGSGTGVEEYKKLLGSSFENEVNLKGELMGPGGMAHIMVGSFMRRVFNNPSPGVSHNLQYLTVWRGKVELRNYEPKRIQGDQEVSFPMPPLVRGWGQFVDRVRRERGNAANEAEGAVA